MIDREEDQISAMAIAEPLLLTLHSILDESVDFYIGDDYSDAARAEHTARAMKNNIYAHAENRAYQKECDTPGLKVLDVRGLKVLNYFDKIVFRLKNVNAEGRHSNNDTQQQRDFDDQLPLEGLPDAAIRLIAGYQLDEAGLSLERIMIARKIGRNVVWTAQVSVIDEAVEWEDITPQRFTGTGAVDFNAQNARGRRG